MSSRPSMGRSAPTTFSFPILKTSDSLDCLVGLGLSHLTEKDLTAPKRETVEKIYEHLLEHCMSKTRDELVPSMEGTAVEVEFPELMDDSVPRFGFIRAMRELLSRCGCPDFSKRDLFKPEGKRLRRHISAIINFAKYRQERLMDFDDMNSQREELMRELEEEEAKVARLEEEVSELHHLREEQLPEINAAIAERDELAAHLAKLDKEQSHLRHDSQQLKQKLAAAKDEVNERRVALDEARMGVERVKAQIVQSPERQKQEHARMAAQKADEEAEGRAIDAQRREMKHRVDKAAKLQGQLEKLFKHLDDTKAKFAEKKAAGKKVKAAQESLGEGRDVLSELKTEKKMLEKNIGRTTEKLADFRSASAMKAESSARALAASTAKYDKIAKENSALSAAVDMAEDKKSTLIAKRDAVRAAHVKAMEEMTGSFLALREQVAQYHARLRTAME